MKKRLLGQTDQYISEISFGAAAISGEAGGYGFGPINEKDSIELIESAVDLGINHFDTAPIYGFGDSEKRLGKALKNQRDKVYLTSKSGITWHSSRRVNLDNSAETTQKMLEQSLRDLQSDYIDFYFIHWPDPRIDTRFAMEVLSKAKDQGKIRFIGLSNTNLEELKKAQEVEQVDIIQGQYNMLYPDLEILLSEEISKDKGFMSWGSFHKGILTGKVDKDRQYHISDGRKKSPWWKRSLVNLDIEKFTPIKDELLNREIDLTSFALGYILRNSNMTTALAGMRTKDYLENTLKSYQQVSELIESGIYDELTLS